MLSFDEFFNACSGLWKTERIYHSLLEGQIERSYTEFRVDLIDQAQKQEILAQSNLNVEIVKLIEQQQKFPGFAITFDTRSETGETVSMSLQALFVPDTYVPTQVTLDLPPPPLSAQVGLETGLIKGFYLRDQGYSEAGAIAGRFSYQPIRQTLEMTTYYRRSVAVDQMRLVAPDVRMRTIVTYQRPQPGEIPTTIDLIGFGVERRYSA
ncbi:phycobiliprotein lyase [Synechocystis sp. PCC 7509]|uniref:phycobiliprotein lyase n=1 Tax=Synechocystis sp. PCC 7509 TaxID=927677 RepID=UPI0002ACC9B7|nr:phycobiliprotein lyase [Synechocystis sp. PCC 7509]